jgi:hypothetical protein
VLAACSVQHRKVNTHSLNCVLSQLDVNKFAAGPIVQFYFNTKAESQVENAGIRSGESHNCHGWIHRQLTGTVSVATAANYLEVCSGTERWLIHLPS